MIFFQGAYDSDLTGAVDINSYKADDSMDISRSNNRTTVVLHDWRRDFDRELGGYQGVGGLEAHNAMTREQAARSEGPPWTGTSNTIWSDPDYKQAWNTPSYAPMVTSGFPHIQSSYPPLLVDYLRGRGLTHLQGDNDFEMQTAGFSNLPLPPAPNTSDGIYSKFQQLLNSYRSNFTQLSSSRSNYTELSTGGSDYTRILSSRSNYTQSSNSGSYLSPLSNGRSNYTQSSHGRSNYTQSSNGGSYLSPFSSGRSNYTPSSMGGSNLSPFSNGRNNYTPSSMGGSYISPFSMGGSYTSPFSNGRSNHTQFSNGRSNLTQLSSSRSDYMSVQTFGAARELPPSYDAVGDDAVIVPFTMFYDVPGRTKDEAPDPSVLPAPNFPAASGLPVISVPLSPASSAASSLATLSLGVLHEEEEPSSIDWEELPDVQDEQAPQEPIPPVNSGASSTPAPDVAPTVASSHIAESSSDAGSYPVTSVSVAFPHPVLQVPRVIVEAPPSGAVQMLAQASTLFLVPASPGKLSRSPSSRSLASSLATSFTSQEPQLPDDLSDRSEKRTRRTFSLREKMGLKKPEKPNNG